MKYTGFRLRIIVIVLDVLIVASLTACQPYEDGPAISFKSAEKRIFGVYHLTEYTVNGVDSLSLFHDSLSLVFDFYYNDVEMVNALAISGSRADGGGCNLYWHWRLSDDEVSLIVDEAPGLSIGTGPFGKGRIGTWTLLRLKSKEIKMKTTYNNKEYQATLVDDF